MKPNIRRCISCRRPANRTEFWRVVRSHPSGEILLDSGMGRSAYLCPTADCLQVAQKKDRIGRALKTKVPDAIYQQLWQRTVATSTASNEFH